MAVDKKQLYEALRRNPPDSVQHEHSARVRSAAEKFFRMKSDQLQRRRDQSEPFDRALRELVTRDGIPARPATKRQAVKAQTPNPPRLAHHILRHGSIHLVDVPPFAVIQASPKGTPPPSSNNDANGGATVAGATGSVTMDVYAGEGETFQGQTNNGPGSCGVWADIGQYYTPPTGPLGPCNSVTEGQLTITASTTVNWASNASSFLYSEPYIEMAVHLVVNNWNSEWDFLGTPVSTPFQYIHQGADTEFGENDVITLNATTAVTPVNNYAVWLEFYAYAWAYGTVGGFLQGESTMDGNFAAVVPSITLDLNYNS